MMEVLTKDLKDLSQRLEVDANAHKEGTGHTFPIVCGAIFIYIFGRIQQSRSIVKLLLGTETLWDGCLSI